MDPAWPGIKLYVGGDASTLQGRRFNATGPRMFTAAHYARCKFLPEEVARIEGMLDSGAFTDVKRTRLDPEAALVRQLAWEERSARLWNAPWQASALASYDELIDEKCIGGERRKERWTIGEADRAVRATVEAAAYLSSRRTRLAPRRLILGCQGVDWRQQEECAMEVLTHATPEDIFGLGGWCILGWQKRWLPEFWATLRKVLPRVAAAGITWVHIYGVTWSPALGGLLWLADRLGLRVSSDSSRPALDVVWPDGMKGGVRMDSWEKNCEYWVQLLATLRESIHYRCPPAPQLKRQEVLFEEAIQ